VTAGNVTGLITRLQANWWVERHPHPTDGRAALLKLTKAGRRLIEAETKLHSEGLEKLFQGISTKERVVLKKALDQFRSSLES